MTSENGAPENGAQPKTFALALTVAIVVFALACAFGTGYFISINGLCEQDTCWLLASGRKIIQLHGLPSVDPFSFTLPLLHRPFVMYQWLSEVSFYGLYKASGLIGLVLFTSLTVALSFICFPLYLSGKLYKQRMLVLLLTCLAALSGLLRFLVRPELFAYTCFSLWFVCLLELERKQSNSKKQGLFIAALVLIMLVWTNMHSSFLLGLVVLSFYVVENIISLFLHGDAERRFEPAKVIALVLSTGVTLCNPYGIGLWHYVAWEILNARWAANAVTEMHPLSSSELANPFVWPFFLLLFACAAIAVTSMSDESILRKPGEKRRQYFSLILLTFFALMPFSARRYIGFCALASTFLLIPFFADRKNASENKLAASLSSQVETFLLRCEAKSKLVPSAIICAMFCIGTWIGAKQNPLTLPQAYEWTKPPFSAIKYLAENPPVDNMLNDPQFGDALIWYHPEQPKVGLDTRFDLYGEPFLREYAEVVLRRRDYKEYFQKYNIHCVFLKPQMPILQALYSDPSWKQCYKDDVAVILKETAIKEVRANDSKK